MTLRKLGIVCGLLAPILWASVIVFCGSLRPGYSHLTQFISELGERGSSTQFIMGYGGFVLTGLLHIAFAASLYAAFRGDRLAGAAAALLALNGVARIGAGIFPCEAGCAGPRVLLSQKLHSVSAATGFLSLIGAAAAWGVVFGRRESLRALSVYSMGSAVLGLVFVALMSWDAGARTATGLYERLSSGILSLWIFVFAARSWRTVDLPPASTR